jgi:hypothetical protein
VTAFRAGFALLVCLALPPAWADGDMSDDGVRARIIEESKAAYPGNCPCPESLDRAGHRCGMRAARARAGGESVLCYPTDVSDEQVTRWRARHDS